MNPRPSIVVPSFWSYTSLADRFQKGGTTMEGRGFIHQNTLNDERGSMIGAVSLPAPTAWPIVLALGIALMLAGMVTHWAISLLGLLLALRATWGWFFQVIPDEHHIMVPVRDAVIVITSTRTIREHISGDL